MAQALASIVVCTSLGWSLSVIARPHRIVWVSVALVVMAGRTQGYAQMVTPQRVAPWCASVGLTRHFTVLPWRANGGYLDGPGCGRHLKLTKFSKY
jgi:hypothetical protein